MNLLLALVSAAGVMAAWEYSGLRKHVVNLFSGAGFSTRDEATDYLGALGTAGEWATCKYCYTPYLGLFFMAVYTAVPLYVSVFLVSFAAAPLAALLASGNRPSPRDNSGLPESSGTEEGKGADPGELPSTGTVETMDDYGIDVPARILNKVEDIARDPEGHREFVQNNIPLFRAMTDPGEFCWSENCKKLAEKYASEKERLQRIREKEPDKCPSCADGRVVNAFLFMMRELADEEEADIGS